MHYELPRTVDRALPTVACTRLPLRRRSAILCSGGKKNLGMWRMSVPIGDRHSNCVGVHSKGYFDHLLLVLSTCDGILENRKHGAHEMNAGCMLLTLLSPLLAQVSIATNP